MTMLMIFVLSFAFANVLFMLAILNIIPKKARQKRDYAALHCMRICPRSRQIRKARLRFLIIPVNTVVN
jgi:hypothetical protein